MACFHPIKGWRSKSLNSSGKRGIVFKSKDAYIDLPVTLPCGRCIGCRLERSKQWAVRCYHEASLHTDNCYVTLTYNDAHLPLNRSLDLRDFQLFMKKLRKKYTPPNPHQHGSTHYIEHKEKHAIRFFHCGEYGPKLGRPHYHAVIFNHSFKDLRLWKQNANGDNLYTSKQLSSLWSREGQSMGFCSIGAVTFQSAAYVARYIMKKVNGPLSEDHYSIYHETTGEIRSKKPEYVTMSRRPGIGSKWLEKHNMEPYPDDFVIVDGKKLKPPKYYDKKLEELHPLEFQELRNKRIQHSRTQTQNQTPERLKVREKVQNARLNKLPRNLD